MAYLFFKVVTPGALSTLFAGGSASSCGPVTSETINVVGESRSLTGLVEVKWVRYCTKAIII